MWLAYLRFDTDRETRIALVRCANKPETDEVLKVAKTLFGAALTEYATFYSGRNIYPKDVPNYSENLIFSYSSFLRACGVTPGQDSRQEGPTPSRPPGSPGQQPAAALPGEARLLGHG